MMYLIVVYAHRLSGYGPFPTEAEARTHADRYFQDYRIEIIPYTKIDSTEEYEDQSKLLSDAASALQAEGYPHDHELVAALYKKIDQDS